MNTGKGGKIYLNNKNIQKIDIKSAGAGYAFVRKDGCKLRWNLGGWVTDYTSTASIGGLGVLSFRCSSNTRDRRFKG